MNYENGKKLTMLGFGLSLLISVAFLVIDVLSLSASVDVLNLSVSVITMLLNYGQKLFIGTVAVGFLLMWMTEKKPLDLVSSVATGISAILGFLNVLGIINIGDIVLSALFSAFYIVLAVRAKNFNIALTLLLVCAFIYRLFFRGFMYLLLDWGISELLLIIILNLGFVVCDGFCLAEVKTED